MTDGRTPPDGFPGDLPDDFDFEIPDDLSSLDAAGAPDEPVVAVVVTQVAEAKPLAAACALAGVLADVVPSPVGALAVLRDATQPGLPARATEAISRMLKQVPVILLDRRAGQITATRWSNGVAGDELPPGLVLSDAPPELEAVLIEGADPTQQPGFVTSVGLSRWKATRILAAAARGGRR
ncbi:hypothetical protein AGMMS50218_07040 [Actinomycetota bacterium]|nr:hypothetical protein AGMMS50218_07040 [Actinomycetota bacterium]